MGMRGRLLLEHDPGSLEVLLDGLLGEERGDLVRLDGEVLPRILQIAVRLLDSRSTSRRIGTIVEDSPEAAAGDKGGQ